jgi:hypothetical protein
MRFFGKRVALNKFDLKKSIIQLTKDLKESIKIDLTNEDPNLSGQEIHELTENTFNMHYQDVKDYEFLNRREGMELLYEEEKNEYEDVTLYFKVTPEALLKLKRRPFDDEKYIHNGYLPNGKGPIDHLFIITVWKKSMLYKALTMTEEDFRYPEYLLPYINLLHKRVQLGFFSSDSDDKPLIDHYFGKQKRHPRSRKLRQSRSRKLRHSRSRK